MSESISQSWMRTQTPTVCKADKNERVSLCVRGEKRKREIIASAQLKRFSPRKSQIKKEIVITSAEFQRKREKISCQDLMLCTFLLCRTLLPPTGLSLSTWTSMKPRQAATIDRDGRTNMRCMFCQYTDAVLVETHQFDTFTSISSTLHYCTQAKKSTLS